MTEFSTCTSDYAVVYRWWSAEDERQVLRHVEQPILSSLATLRCREPGVAVYVIDYTEGGYDWGDFPSRLDFSLIPRRAAFESGLLKKESWWMSDVLCVGRGPLETASDHPEDNLDCLDVRSCSWPLDIGWVAGMIPERYIVASDADVFWLRPLFPLGGDPCRINARSDNSGVIYFDKESDDAARWLEVWRAYCCLAVRDFDFRRRVCSLFPHPAPVSADKIYRYLRVAFTDLVSKSIHSLTERDVLLPSDFDGRAFSPEHIESLRWVHMASDPRPPHRGRFPLLFRETFDSMRPFFSAREFLEMYGMDAFRNSIFGLLDLSEPPGSSFYRDFRERLFDKIRPL